jgi:hypothetical protein
MTEHGDWGLLLGLVDWLAEKEVLMKELKKKIGPVEAQVEENIRQACRELDKVDMINHPLHYIRGKIEVADFILDQGLTWCLGNAIKYICRAGYRPDADPIEDLKKGIWYMEREIREREKTKWS